MPHQSPMTVPAGQARALPRRRRPAPGQRAGPRPRLRATTSRHTRNGRSAACDTTSGPIATSGQGAAQSPAAASSSTQAGRPAERSIRPVTGSGRALSDDEPAGCARGTGPASDPCRAAGAMTMPCPLTCPNRIRAEPTAGPPPEPRSESQYECHSTAATVPTQHPVRGQHGQACTRPSMPTAPRRKISGCGCSTISAYFLESRSGYERA